MILFRLWMLILFIGSILGGENLRYFYEQAAGQIKIIFHSRDINSITDNPSVPDSIRNQIRLVQEIKHFAENELELYAGNNYTTFYDQKGQEIMWVLTAAAPFQLKAKKWSFPIIGEFTYKGYFNEKRAYKEEMKLKKAGYDTNIRNASGWSTLGFFKDPILSNMLNRKVGSLAELIIHELTHGTVFVRDSLEFNENLATFIGIQGATLFLLRKYGMDSEEYKEYQSRNSDRMLFTNYLLQACAGLDSIYSTFTPTLSESEKIRLKNDQIERIVNGIHNLPFNNPGPYRELFSLFKPNNAYLISFLVYRGGQEYFKKEWEQKFEGNLKEYIRYLKTVYSS